MRFFRVLCVVALVGLGSLVARADATSGDFPDPHPKFVSPDPACDPPYCVNLTYTGPDMDPPGAAVQLFFSSDPAFPPGVPANPPAFGCDFLLNGVSEPCLADVFPDGSSPTGSTFAGFTLFVPRPVDTGMTFSLTSLDGTVALILPDDVCAQNSDGQCTGGGGVVTVVPTPEPGTASLFAIGFLLLGGAALSRRRWGVGIVS